MAGWSAYGQRFLPGPIAFAAYTRCNVAGVNLLSCYHELHGLGDLPVFDNPSRRL